MASPVPQFRNFPLDGCAPAEHLTGASRGTAGLQSPECLQVLVCGGRKCPPPRLQSEATCFVIHSRKTGCTGIGNPVLARGAGPARKTVTSRRSSSSWRYWESVLLPQRNGAALRNGAAKEEGLCVTKRNAIGMFGWSTGSSNKLRQIVCLGDEEQIEAGALSGNRKILYERNSASAFRRGL